MESYEILLLMLFLILTVILGILLARVLSGQRCTISLQRRVPNHKLTQIQQENERKQQNKFSSRLNRAFSTSSKTEAPSVPVEDVKTVEFTLDFGNDDQNNVKTIPLIDEPEVEFPPKQCSTQAELDQRAKRREELRRKYNL